MSFLVPVAGLIRPLTSPSISRVDGPNNGAKIKFDNNPASEYTFSSVNFGLGHPTREFIGTVTLSRSNATLPSISSITVSGVTATIIDTLTSTSGSLSDSLTIFQVTLSAGESGDIVVTSSNACNSCSASLFRIIRKDSLGSSPHDSDTFNSSLIGPSATATCPADGFAFAAAYNADSQADCTVTGDISEIVDQSLSAVPPSFPRTDRMVIGYSSIQSVETSLTGTFTWGGGANRLMGGIWTFK